MENDLITVLGRQHLLVLHFPIALLIVAAAWELLRKDRSRPAQGASVVVALGAISAVVAAACGWLYAEEKHVGGDEDLLLWHRWSGVTCAALAVAAAGFARAAARQPARHGAPYRVLLVLSAVAVVVAGHFGGTLVWEEGYVWGTAGGASTSPAADPERATETAAPAKAGTPRPSSAEPSGPAEPSEASPAPAPSADPVDFTRDVLPIFQEHCYECHGPTGKARAMLRLSNVDQLLDPDPEFRILVPGNAADSLLFQLVSLPAGHEDLMPKKSDPLAPEKIETLRAWIDAGAEHPERPQ